MTDIKKILSSLNIVPKKQLGQNFLFDEHFMQLICSKIKEFYFDRPILEIGPGLGILTEKLSFSKEIRLIELEKNLFSYLKKKMPNVNILLGDCLLVDWDEFMGKDVSYFVYSNLPYSLATKIMFKWMNSADNSSTAMFMVQKEVAEKICAKEGNKKYSSLSATFQYFCNIELLYDNIPSKFFYPEPKIESSILLFNKKRIYDKNFSNFLKLVFRHKRKTMINNLKDIYNIDILKKVFHELKLDEKCRAEIFKPEKIFIFFQLLSAFHGRK